MAVMNSSVLFKFLTLALSVELLLIADLPAQAQLGLGTRSTTLPERLIFQENFDPPGDGEP